LKIDRDHCIVCIMETTLRETPANQSKLSRASAAWSSVLGEVLQRGFHGLAQIEVTVQDGTIQQIRRSVERIER
jgi:hypothetical protein